MRFVGQRSDYVDWPGSTPPTFTDRNRFGSHPRRRSPLALIANRLTPEMLQNQRSWVRSHASVLGRRRSRWSAGCQIAFEMVRTPVTMSNMSTAQCGGFIRPLIREPRNKPATHGTREVAASRRSKTVINPGWARATVPIRLGVEPIELDTAKCPTGTAERDFCASRSRGRFPGRSAS